MRRRLDFHGRSSSWPGKDPAWRFEQVRYDHYLVMAAQMLDLPVPDHSPGRPLDAAARAALKDRLALAGFDVLAPADRSTGDIARGATESLSARRLFSGT